MEDARDETSLESQLKRGLETQLERFLDIFCFIQQFSLNPVSAGDLAEKISLPGDSFFGLSLPFSGKFAFLVISNENNVLPEWYKNPGVAGKSRLTFFAGNLSDLLSKNTSFFEETSPFTDDMEAESMIHENGSPEKTPDFSTFLHSDKYAGGKMRASLALFSRMKLAPGARLLSFSIMRFDGNPGRGWLITAVENPEILRDFLCGPAANTAEKTQRLKRVRELEVLSLTESEQQSAKITEPGENAKELSVKDSPEEKFRSVGNEKAEKEQKSQETEQNSPDTRLEKNDRVSEDELRIAEQIIGITDEKKFSTKTPDAFIFAEKPEYSSVNTDEIRYVREEFLLPFNEEKFRGAFREFLATRNECVREKQKNCDLRRMNHRNGIYSNKIFRKARGTAFGIFSQNSHPKITQRWRDARPFLSFFEEKKAPITSPPGAFRPENLLENADFEVRADIKCRADQPVLSPEKVLQGIPVTVRAVLGRKKFLLEAILGLEVGAILNFGHVNEADLELFVSDKCVARGGHVPGESAVAVEILEKTT